MSKEIKSEKVIEITDLTKIDEPKQDIAQNV